MNWLLPVVPEIVQSLPTQVQGIMPMEMLNDWEKVRSMSAQSSMDFQAVVNAL
jgi:hypothetical protein